MIPFTDEEIYEAVKNNIPKASQYVSSHGGGITLHGVKDATAYIELTGTCSGCSMSLMTTKMVVQRELRALIHPELHRYKDYKVSCYHKKQDFSIRVPDRLLFDFLCFLEVQIQVLLSMFHKNYIFWNILLKNEQSDSQCYFHRSSPVYNPVGVFLRFCGRL